MKSGVVVSIVLAIALLAPVMLAQDIKSIVENVNATGQLEVVHWWTAGGEKEGINEALNYFSRIYPKVRVISGPIAGGAGTNLKQVVKTRVVAGNAPESFQCHAGYEMYPYYDGDLLYNCDDVWSYMGLESVTPDMIEEICKIDGHYYCVPIGIHRTNVVFYNKGLFEEYGVEEPSSNMTLREFFDFVAELQEKLPRGVYALGLGDRNNWEATHIFETLMLAENPQTYENFINGKVTAEELVPALEAFQEYLGYVAPDHRARTWDEECGMIMQGKVAMLIHGDWAKGYFTANGWEYGKDFGAFVVPGTEGWFGASTDAFVRPKSSTNPENAIRWQATYVTLDAQKMFNPAKGSVSPYTHVPTDIYDEYSKEAAEDLYSADIKIYPSIAHGSGSPEQVLSQLNVIIGDFAQNPQNVQGTANAIVNVIRYVEHPVQWDII